MSRWRLFIFISRARFSSCADDDAGRRIRRFRLSIYCGFTDSAFGRRILWPTMLVLLLISARDFGLRGAVTGLWAVARRQIEVREYISLYISSRRFRPLRHATL